MAMSILSLFPSPSSSSPRLFSFSFFLFVQLSSLAYNYHVRRFLSSSASIISIFSRLFFGTYVRDMIYYERLASSPPPPPSIAIAISILPPSLGGLAPLTSPRGSFSSLDKAYISLTYLFVLPTLNTHRLPSPLPPPIASLHRAIPFNRSRRCADKPTICLLRTETARYTSPYLDYRYAGTYSKSMVAWLDLGLKIIY